MVSPRVTGDDLTIGAEVVRRIRLATNAMASVGATIAATVPLSGMRWYIARLRAYG